MSNRRKRNTLAALAVAAAAAAPAQAQVVTKATHPNGEVAFVVDFEVKPGFEAEFERLSQRSAHCARLDPGNAVFEVHKVIGAERAYAYHIVWRSPEALQSHLQRPYTKELVAMFGRALARPLSESIRYIRDLAPPTRPPAAEGDPADDPVCR